MSTSLTASRLRELLHYAPETGVFTRAVTTHQGRWRKGTVAGCLTKMKSGGTYVVVRVDGRLYLAHRLAWLWMTGEWPTLSIDHRDGDGTNNRWSNLRQADAAENAANRGKQSNNACGYKGVYFQKDINRYRSRICVRGRFYELGCFSDPVEAHAAYAEAADRLLGEFARAA